MVCISEISVGLDRLLPELDHDQVTVKSMMRLLEQELGLEAHALKSERKVITEMIQQKMSDNTENEDPAPKRVKKSSSSSFKKPASKNQPPKKSIQEVTGLSQLKGYSKAAGILTPAVYRQLKNTVDDAEREDVLRQAIEAKGFSFRGTYPTSSDIVQAEDAKAKRDALDGLDTSQIMTSTRRRTSRHVPPLLQDMVSSASEEEEEEENSSENDAYSDSDEDGASSTGNEDDVKEENEDNEGNTESLQVCM